MQTHMYGSLQNVMGAPIRADVHWSHSGFSRPCAIRYHFGPVSLSYVSETCSLKTCAASSLIMTEIISDARASSVFFSVVNQI